MKWKQFFTTITSLTWEEAHQLADQTPGHDVIFLDVRQPKEYEREHLPGAKLIPLGELESRLSEIDQQTQIVIYCASGVRSRVATQMLVGNRYEAYNLTGGIKAWKKEVAIGGEDTGLYMFSELKSPEDAIIVGFGLEAGLREFYLSIQKKVSLESTKQLLGKLAEMEIYHQERLVSLYSEVTGIEISIEEFGETIVEPVMEGGLTTEEYLQLYDIDFQSEIELLGLALAIEAQALDLYLRAAERAQVDATRQVLLTIAGEERSHISWLSRSIDQHQELA